MRSAPTILLTLWSVTSVAACNVQPTAELAAFGDSVTWGYGDLPGGWVRQLEDKSGYAIANLGVPGERADGGAGRIDAALTSVPRASVVFVLHGGNDWVKAYRSSWCNKTCDPSEVDNKYESIGKYLRDIRRRIDAAGKTPVFLTYWPSSHAKCDKYDDQAFDTYIAHRRRLNAEIAEVAAEHDDAVILTGEMPGFGDDGGDFFDCLHPSATGYRKIADRIMDDIDRWEPPEPDVRDIFDVRF